MVTRLRCLKLLCLAGTCGTEANSITDHCVHTVIETYLCLYVPLLACSDVRGTGEPDTALLGLC